MDRLLASICPAYTWQRSRQFVCLLQYALLSAWQRGKRNTMIFAAFLFLSSFIPAGFIQLQAQTNEVVIELEQQLIGNKLTATLYASLETGTAPLALGPYTFLLAANPEQLHLKETGPNSVQLLDTDQSSRVEILVSSPSPVEGNSFGPKGQEYIKLNTLQKSSSLVPGKRVKIATLQLSLQAHVKPEQVKGLTWGDANKSMADSLSAWPVDLDGVSFSSPKLIFKDPSPVKFASSDLHLAAKVLLQGAFRKNTGMVPALTPFLYGFVAGSVASPDASIGHMNAGYTVPNEAIDVIKVELRPFVNKSTTIASKYAWLLADGSLRDFETGLLPYLTFSHQVSRDESYHVVVKHRNHLTLMSSSSSPVKLVPDRPGNNPSEGFIDLTDIANIYGPGAVFLGRHGYAMVAGNARNTDQEINGNDLFDVSTDSDAPVDTGYKVTDYTLDGKCNATDFQLVSEANDRLFSSTAINP